MLVACKNLPQHIQQGSPQSARAYRPMPARRDMLHVSRPVQPRRINLAPQALAAPMSADLVRQVAAPMLATTYWLLRDPNASVALSGMLGAVAMELGRQQSNMRRIACVAMAVVSPWVAQQAVGCVMAQWSIDAARVPMQAVLDTALASMVGTTVALFSSITRPPWASPDSPLAIEGPSAPLIIRFALAATAAPILFHTLMATSLTQAAANTMRALGFAVHAALLVGSRLS